ncbi:MAG: hypothetical protein ACK559_24060, partial [bacterium]
MEQLREREAQAHGPERLLVGPRPDQRPAVAGVLGPGPGLRAQRSGLRQGEALVQPGERLDGAPGGGFGRPELAEPGEDEAQLRAGALRVDWPAQGARRLHGRLQRGLRVLRLSCAEEQLAPQAEAPHVERRVALDNVQALRLLE